VLRSSFLPQLNLNYNTSALQQFLCYCFSIGNWGVGPLSKRLLYELTLSSSMVLQELMNPFSVKTKPWQMFLCGSIYSVLALFLSYFVFKEIAGILMVFLIVLATVPAFYVTIKREEELELEIEKEWVLLKEHTKVLIFLMCLFLGITSSLAVCYVFLPSGMVESVFSLQKQAIIAVNQNTKVITGNVASVDLLGKILFNNFKVLFFCLLFSLLYGTGAIFILTWNASVIAAAMGNFIKAEVAQGAALVGFVQVSSYFAVATYGFFRYMTHGFFEIVAYFTAGLAGGILSIAIIKHNLKEEGVIVDSVDLILISVGVLVLAGFIEVYITPLLF